MRLLAGLVIMVREKGLEPPRLAALEPKSSASTNSATLALNRPFYPRYRFTVSRRANNLRGEDSLSARTGLLPIRYT